MSDFGIATPIRKTRKARVCMWCRAAIPSGSAAVKISGKWEGFMSRCYVHPDCNDAWLRDPCNADGEGCPYEHTQGLTCAEMEDRRTAHHWQEVQP